MKEEFTEPGPFKAGDVVKIVETIFLPEYLGCLITITGPLERKLTWAGDIFVYPTDRLYQGRTLFVRPEQVRGRKPPGTGEESIMNMFTIDYREKETA